MNDQEILDRIRLILAICRDEETEFGHLDDTQAREEIELIAEDIISNLTEYGKEDHAEIQQPR